MGGQYPPLDRAQVEKILAAIGFSIKRRASSHAQWEGYTNGQRRIVTVGHMKSRKEQYGRDLMKKMIRQSGLSKKDFYSHL